MPAFKLFLQIVNSKKYMIILYYGIFLVIFLLISGLTAQSAEGQYEETSLNVGAVSYTHRDVYKRQPLSDRITAPTKRTAYTRASMSAWA